MLSTTTIMSSALRSASARHLLRCSSSSSSPVQPIVELREYALDPRYASNFLDVTRSHAALRRSLAPLRLFTTPDTGGDLHVATHFYYYEGGYAERDAGRAAMAASKPWQEYLRHARPAVTKQSSLVFVEAPILADHGVGGLAAIDATDGNTDKSVYELRRYKLRLGYDTVPNFLELYGTGLPSKLHAEGTDPSTSLVTLLYNEVGRLNEVIEIWRHGDGTAAMERSRVAARGATEWRNSIKNIAGLALEFTNTIHKPEDFSPMR